ncbi:GNAT family N-acetyltransferase [Nocardioides rubriscoriae]|uniref:GNAT family N-acetyltransferase n=1 Tax=Nocardioides rubriscoriae TaxID=642762 RepID=UPI001478534E|nr:GNAT family N-acetyltransferase [Nocardioides rubriscoriae]
MTASPVVGEQGGPASDVLLSDGSIAAIRPLRPGDRAAVEALHEGISAASTRYRFFTTGRATGVKYVDHLYSDASAEIALVALVGGRVVALATAERIDATSAEVAFLVADELHGHGLGSLLLEHLAATGRDRGISRFVAEILTDNTAMAEVFVTAGFEIERDTAHGVTEVEMSTAASATAVAAADARECTSQARSLAGLMRPQRVAVVGVRRDGSGTGAAVLASIRTGGFTGDVVVVHPDAGPARPRVAGAPAYAHLVDVPGHVDLVVVAVPARRVLGVVADAALAGAGTVVVVSSGFAETGAEGERRQRDLVRLARDHDLRLVGPHSLGVQVNDPCTRLNATVSDLVPRPEGLALASQSHGVGVALLETALRTGLGLRTFVSLGTKADVSGNDLLAAWLDDPTVTAAGLYLESFGNAPKLARLARRFSERKPLLVVVGGRSVHDRRGGAAPTGASAPSAVAVDALFGHSGIIACRDVPELAETALVLAEQPRPAGRRLAVLSNAGGPGVLGADAAVAAGLVVPPLSEGLRARLAGLVPEPARPDNPVDVGAATTPHSLEQAADALLGSGSRRRSRSPTPS